MKKYDNVLTSTALIPLWAKAVEAEEQDPILRDPSARSILDFFGYDLQLYDKRKQNPSQVGCCLRARWIDERTSEFIEQHKPCQVIQLGAGLDDRFRRLGNPAGVEHWYDLDLAEVTAMRRTVIPEVAPTEILTMDLFSRDWMRKMRANGLPSLVIVEGVMMYLEEERIAGLFRAIAEELGEVELLFDSVPFKGVGRAKNHDSVQKYNKEVEYLWGLKEVRDVEKLAECVRLVEGVRMSDLPKARRFSWWLRILYRIPYFYRNFNHLLLRIRIAPSIGSRK